MPSDVLNTIFMRIQKFKIFFEKHNSLSKRKKIYIYVFFYYILPLAQ